MTPKVYGYRTVLERVCYDHMDRQYGVWQRLKVLATRAALTILLEGVHPKNRVYLQRLEYLPPCEGRSNAEWFIKKVRLFK